MVSPCVRFILLFVKNPSVSKEFYSKILSIEPIEESPTFVLFDLKDGLKLGLWSQDTARPAVSSTGGGSEICFMEDDVEGIYLKWSSLGIPMAMSPAAMDGMSSTFVALDPDGHRIRVLKF